MHKEILSGCAVRASAQSANAEKAENDLKDLHKKAECIARLAHAVHHYLDETAHEADRNILTHELDEDYNKLCEAMDEIDALWPNLYHE